MSESTEPRNGSRLDQAKSAVDDTLDKAREQLGHARERVQETADKVNDRLADAHIPERIEEVREQARRRADRLGEAARDQYATRSEQLKEGYSKVQGNVRDASDDLGVFVRDNPGRAVLIAAAAGFLIGLLFRGRKDA